MLSRVDLPAPEGPKMQVSSPERNSPDTLCRMRRSPGTKKSIFSFHCYLQFYLGLNRVGSIVFCTPHKKTDTNNLFVLSCGLYNILVRGVYVINDENNKVQPT